MNKNVVTVKKMLSKNSPGMKLVTLTSVPKPGSEVAVAAGFDVMSCSLVSISLHVAVVGRCRSYLTGTLEVEVSWLVMGI